jgi:hypothetical protein
VRPRPSGGCSASWRWSLLCLARRDLVLRGRGLGLSGWVFGLPGRSLGLPGRTLRLPRRSLGPAGRRFRPIGWCRTGWGRAGRLLLTLLPCPGRLPFVRPHALLRGGPLPGHRLARAPPTVVEMGPPPRHCGRRRPRRRHGAGLRSGGRNGLGRRR